MLLLDRNTIRFTVTVQLVDEGDRAQPLTNCGWLAKAHSTREGAVVVKVELRTKMKVMVKQEGGAKAAATTATKLQLKLCSLRWLVEDEEGQGGGGAGDRGAAETVKNILQTVVNEQEGGRSAKMVLSIPYTAETIAMVGRIKKLALTVEVVEPKKATMEGVDKELYISVMGRVKNEKTDVVLTRNEKIATMPLMFVSRQVAAPHLPTYSHSPHSPHPPHSSNSSHIFPLSPLSPPSSLFQLFPLFPLSPFPPPAPLRSSSPRSPLFPLTIPITTLPPSSPLFSAFFGPSAGDCKRQGCYQSAEEGAEKV
jgi:hypothetical protein